MSVFLLRPAFKDYIWGGTRLKTDFDKETDLKIVAESWEVSCHKDGPSVIDGGEMDGQTLQQLITQKGADALGSRCEKFESFPILIKLIDAKDNLSVQVHPDNEYALRVEKEYGKTEMWYIVDCDEGAELLYGFKKETSKDEFRQRIEDNTLLDVVNAVKVKKGDVFFIDAGTLHAIGKGILIAEIQQNSNTTYRIYDFGRVGADGKPRELHIDKAVEVTELSPPKRACEPFGAPQQISGGVSTLLAECEYFTVYSLQTDGTMSFDTKGESFHCLLCLDGECKVSGLTLKKGQSAFITADTGVYNISGNANLILSYV